MGDLIDRAEAQTEIMMSKNVYMLKGEPVIRVSDAVQVLRQLTSANVGKWLDHQNGTWIYAKCSKCESVHDVKSKYCPTCGAKMKMEGDDDLS